MQPIGIIFDFNGTMLFDRMYHLKAWERFIEDLTSQKPGEADVLAYIDNKGPREILDHFMPGLSDATVQQFGDEKEQIYRSMLKESPLPLAPGLEGFLNYLKQTGLPRAIATSAPAENLVLYNELYRLDLWFDKGCIINASDDIPAKPHPALYQAAVKILGVEAAHCLVFEDSSLGIEAARSAGIKSIIRICADKPGGPDDCADYPELLGSISDFTQLGSVVTF